MAGYVIAVLLCLGDNCDLVRVEPGVEYSTYETCSAAIAKNASKIGETTGRLQFEEGRQGDIICLRDRLTIRTVDEEHEALAPTAVREQPDATSPRIDTIEGGGKVHVVGAVAGTSWLRVVLPNGTSGYVYGERLRKLAMADAPATGSSAAQPPPSAPPSPTAAPSAQRAAPQRQAVVAPPPSPPAAPGPAAPPAQEFRDCASCPTMIGLPGGAFQMGSTADPSERPPHRVTVAPFAIGKFEVTQGEWKACVAAGGCADRPLAADNDRLPMMNLSWDDATRYVQWLRGASGKPYRLPSEAEWEYAARAGTTTPYPWGREIGAAKASCNGCGAGIDPHLPAAAGSFPPNPWGVHDMLGGVAEWVEDCWHKSYDGAPANASAWSAQRCGQRVLRGGSWKNGPADLTVSARNFYDASVRYSANGLRVALSLGEAR